MKESTIGIKIANGSYFPVLKENSTGKKKLVLTTVQENQESVQIDLYKGAGTEIADALYIGSLVIEKIERARRGDPEIELVLGIDKEGNLNASASDRKTGDKQNLSISLKTLTEENTYDIPDFDLNDTPAPPEDFNFEEDGLTEDFDIGETGGDRAGLDKYGEESGFEEDYAAVPEKKRAAVHPLLLAGFVVMGLAIVALVVLLLFKIFQGPGAPPLEAAKKTELAGNAEPVGKAQSSGSAEPAKSVEPSKSAEPAEPSVVSEGGTAAASAPSKESGQQPAEPAQTTTGAGGKGAEPPKIAAQPEPKAAAGTDAADGFLTYRILWGDTLWWLAWKYYKDPWQYWKIAQENKIKNPDRIFAGMNILIPKK